MTKGGRETVRKEETFVPRDMFGDVVDPSIKVGGQKWYLVPVCPSLLHTVLILAVIIIPLLAADALPRRCRR